MDTCAKIIIVDDHPLFREGIRLLIEKEGIGEVIAEAENGQVFLDLMEKYEPDLVLMDIEMPVMNGLVATKKAKEIRPGLHIIALTMLKDRENYTGMIRAGAMGFVLKTSGKQELEKAIRTVVRGECYFSNELLRQIIINSGNQQPIRDNQGSTALEFSDRELEVLKYLCQGLSVSEISEKLYRSIKTIEAHRSKLLQKTNTKNTVNLILFAIRNKLVDL